MKAELVPDNGDPPIRITKDLSVVGRRGYCDVVVDDPSVSKRHCVLVKTDGLLVIRDLGSTNGTKVKGQRVRWAALLPDDRISVGSYKFRVYLGPDDTPGPSELVEIRKAKAQAAGYASEARPEPTEPNPLLGLSKGGLIEPASWDAETPMSPEGGVADYPPLKDREHAFANAKTPPEGQELILEVE